MSPATILALLSIIVAVVSLLGGPLGAYIAVRVGLATLQATVTAKLDEIARRLEKSEDARDRDQRRISALEAKDAAKEARLRALEKLLAIPAHSSEPPSEDERG